MKWRAIVALVCASLAAGGAAAAPAQAAPPVLELPLACDLPERCFIAFYIDHASGPTRADHRCGNRTYDNHRGIDFRVRSLGDFAAGIAVLAAADGTVVALRDEMDDIDVLELGRDKIANRANGNTVLLQHEDGWVTEYLHLRRGSVAVRVGQRVSAGQPLGLMGLSGDTNFPHLHFELRDRSRAIVDPFNGQSQTVACQLAGASLWSSAAQAVLNYRPVEMVGGFTASQPSRNDAIYGRIAAPHVGGSLAFWFEMYGVAPGDVVGVQFVLPDGTRRRPQQTTIKDAGSGVIYRTAILNPQVTLIAGTYAVVVSVKRSGAALFERRFDVEVK